MDTGLITTWLMRRGSLAAPMRSYPGAAFVVVLDPSGAGKTALLNMVKALDAPRPE
jgi:ABC-type thiamine transport system ATPase subunit